jgi:hypothetical protein
VPKKVTEEVRKLVQRGLQRFEHGELQGAVSDWEIAARLDISSVQARRLANFGQRKLLALESGTKDSVSRRATLESPIPQFLAALTERQSDEVDIQDKDTAAPDLLYASGDTPRLSRKQKHADDSGNIEQHSPDTLENLHVHTEDVRASANELIGECRNALNQNKGEAASFAGELALQVAERAPPPGVNDLIEASRALFERAFRACLGNLQDCPLRAAPAESLTEHGFDNRAAFLMSRMDGSTSIADLIDSSGMSRFETVRILAALRRAKVIDILTD